MEPNVESDVAVYGVRHCARGRRGVDDCGEGQNPGTSTAPQVHPANSSGAGNTGASTTGASTVTSTGASTGASCSGASAGGVSTTGANGIGTSATGAGPEPEPAGGMEDRT